METIESRYDRVRSDIAQFCAAHGRESSTVKLVAVSKRHDVDKVHQLALLGHKDFAENYLQEGLGKILALDQLLGGNARERGICWHFIGHIQSKKSKSIAENFDWVHTVESTRVADRLNQHRDPGAPLNVLIQVNLQGEESKSGISVSELIPLASHIATLANLRLRGIMVIPRPQDDFDSQRGVFRQCRDLLSQLRQQGYDADQLSMGMTDDMEAAIAEGSTMVRIGTALFGPRPIN